MTIDHKSAELGQILQRITIQCTAAALHQATAFGIPEAQARALAAFDADDAVRIGELAHRMSLAPSRLTRLVDGLVESGLAGRVPDPEDRRATLVALTAAGKKAKQGLKLVCEKRYRSILGQMTQEKRTLLLELLSELVATMEALAPCEE